MTEFYMEAYKGFGGCALHDPLAVGVVIDADFFKTVRMNVQVDVEGLNSLGRTVGDLRNKPLRAPSNMDVCIEVDSERFLERFLSRIGIAI